VTSYPDKIYDALYASVSVLRELRTSIITDRDLQRAKRTLLTRHESDLKTNVYWLGLLTHLQNSRVSMGGRCRRRRSSAGVRRARSAAAASLPLRCRRRQQPALCPIACLVQVPYKNLECLRDLNAMYDAVKVRRLGLGLGLARWAWGWPAAAVEPMAVDL
jgi:hypothetical protein